MFFLNLLSIALLFIAIVFIISVVIGVPFLPTNRKQAKLMMELAGIKEGSVVIDLGSGAGRLLFLAAKKGARAIGYELNPFLVWWTRLMIKLKKLDGRVEVKCENLYNADFKNVDVVFAFLFNNPMKKLENKLFSELHPGAKIVSYVFPISGRVPVVKEQGIFVYVV